MNIFPENPMQVLADLIHGQLGIDVRLRGRTICCDYSYKPPTIFLPNLEFAKPEDISVLAGFAIHEAGHVRWTDPKVLMENYLVKDIQNAFEDNYIERRLKAEFPGADEQLRLSHDSGYQMFLKQREGKSKELLLHLDTPESFLDSPRLVTEGLAYYGLALVQPIMATDGKEIDYNDLDKTYKVIHADYCRQVVDLVGSDNIKALLKEKGIDPEGKDLANEVKRLKLAPEVLALVGLSLIRERMARLGMADLSAKNIRAEYARRKEVSLLCWLWSYDWRKGQDKRFREQFAKHPWKPILDEVTHEKAHNSRQCLEQAQRLIERVEAHPVLPDDSREVSEAEKRLAAAGEKRDACRDAEKEVRRMERQRDRETREKVESSMEKQEHLEALDSLKEAEELVEEAAKALAKTRERLGNAKEAQRRVSQRLVEERRKFRELRKEQAKAEKDAQAAQKACEEGGLTPKEKETREQARQQAEARNEELKQRLGRMEERILADEQLQERRRESVEKAEMHEDEAQSDSTSARLKKMDAVTKKDEAEKKFGEMKAETDEAVKQEYEPRLNPLRTLARQREVEAKEAEAHANSLLVVIKRHDDQIEAPINPGVLEKILREVYEKVKDTPLEDDLPQVIVIEEDGKTPDSDDAKEILTAAPKTALSARKYIPFDRSEDKVDRVGDTPKALEDYEAARKEYEGIIEETAARLRKLYSPEKMRLKVNAEHGKLDPRKAYKIGLAKAGVAVDLTRVWRAITTRKDPRVAVSLLIDFSGSMSGPNIHLARCAAAALSEVMRQLGIPHEIIGHTTNNAGVAKLHIEDEQIGDWSRMLPFQGYVFKEFGENKPPVSVFHPQIGMRENLDGEAVQWALSRLAVRKERTKVCVVICDGLPHAALSRIEELERHLYTVCKQAEAQEKSGLFLSSIGIGCERVKAFYKNAEVLNDIDELPQTVLGIVERILTQVGTMA